MRLMGFSVWWSWLPWSSLEPHLLFYDQITSFCSRQEHLCKICLKARLFRRNLIIWSPHSDASASFSFMTLQFSPFKSFLDIPLKLYSFSNNPNSPYGLSHRMIISSFSLLNVHFISFHFASHFVMPRKAHTFLCSPFSCQSSTFPLWLYMYMCPRDGSNHTAKISQQLNKTYWVFSTSWTLRSSLNLPCCRFWKSLVFVAGFMNNCLC